MNRVIVYIHGQGGNAREAEHYRPLFPDSDVIGLDYVSSSPWEAQEELPGLFDGLCGQYESVILIANSIGAYFAMCALSDRRIEKAFFISPVVDMKRLIEDMMLGAGVSERELRERGEVTTPFGQTLSWRYLSYVTEHPVGWTVPTHILYGSRDGLTPFSVISDFAEKTGAELTVMENGEHWFHTQEQMAFLDRWIEASNGKHKNV